MIPDVLISKYLDGELSLEEDVQFRAMLGSDPEAREAFDTAVLLHIAMRCEDDTTVPVDVAERVLAFIEASPMYAQSAMSPLAQTFDASAHANTGLSVSRSTQGRGLARGSQIARRQTGRVLAAAALLLVLALPFGDQFLNMHSSLVKIDQVESTGIQISRPGGQVPERLAVARVRATVSAIGSTHVAEPLMGSVDAQKANSVIGTQDQRTSPTAVGLEIASDVRPSEGQILPTGNNDGKTESSSIRPSAFIAPSLHSLFASADLPAAAAAASGTPAKAALVATDEAPIDVLVSTSFSQSMASPTEGAVTTVAAGIGYGVASNTFVGMELGSTQYTRTNETNGLVDDNGTEVIADIPATRAARVDHIGHLSKITAEPNYAPRYRTEVHTSLSPEGTLWGAAFVQHSLIKTSLISMNGRVGAGVGEDGMLTYGRMQAECNLFSSVSLTIGAEARYSPFRTGVNGGQPMARKYGTVISALYGLQVRL